MGQRAVHAAVLHQGMLPVAVLPACGEHQHVEYQHRAYHRDDVHENVEPGVVRLADEHGQRHSHEEAQHVAEHDVAYAFQQ